MLKWYFLFLGFTSAFSLSSWVPLVMALSILLLAQLMHKVVLAKKIFINKSKVLILYSAFLMVVSCSFLFQNYSIGFSNTGLNHTIAYFVVIFMYYGVVSLSLVNFKITNEKIFRFITYGVILVSCFSIVEFLIKNFTGLPFDSWIPRIAGEDYNPIYFIGSSMIYRARGVMSESGYLALYLLMFLPLAFYYFNNVQKNKSKLYATSALILTAVSVSFSSAGIAEFLIATSFTLLMVSLSADFHIKINIKYVFALLFIIPLIILYLTYSDTNFSALSGIMDKITFVNDSGRFVRWEFAKDLFLSHPLLGQGPGISSILYGTGSTSFYLETLVETGIIGTTLFLSIMLYYLRIIFKIKDTVKYAYLFSYTVAVIHYFIISAFYLPWMWTLFAIISYTYHYERLNFPRATILKNNLSNLQK